AVAVAVSPADGSRRDDAVELLDLPEPPEGVRRRPALLDPRIDGYPAAERRVLDRLEERHGDTHLLGERRVLGVLERDSEEVRRDEHSVLGTRDADGGIQDSRVEAVAREGEQDSTRLARYAQLPRRPAPV